MGDSTKKFAEEVVKSELYSEAIQLFAKNYLALEAENQRLREALHAIRGMPESVMDLSNAKYVARIALGEISANALERGEVSGE